MRRLVRLAREGDTGAVAVIVAVAATALFAFGAMAVDMGNAWARKRLTQTDADLAALAGAAQLTGKSSSEDPAKLAAWNWLDKNLPNDDQSGFTLNSYAQYTDGDETNGEITVSNNYAKITVVVQPRNVSFGLANAIGFKSVDVRATAAAGLFSPADKIFPYLLADGTPPGLACLKDTSNGQAKPDVMRAAFLPQAKPVDPGSGGNNGGGNCAGSIEGNFGFANIPRNSKTETPELPYNIRYGADHNPAVINPIPPTEPTVCIKDGNPTGAILDSNKAPYIDGFNCIGSQSVTGQNMPDIVQGLVHFSGPNACDGRLIDTASTLVIDGCPISTDKFATYLPVGTTPAQLLSGSVTSVINQAIVNDPRFGFVPVISSQTLPQQGGSNVYAIINFYGVYYHDFFDQQGNLITSDEKNVKIGAVDAYVFPLGFLPNEIIYKGAVGSYIGVGPHVSRLVE